MIVAFWFFMDIFIDYSDKVYDFLMSFIAYTFACAGISYLSNLVLIILIDMGKHRWLFSDDKLRSMRRWVHIGVGLLNAAILT